jgi:ABC-type antimicrobial peptide transport system permease subunit
MLHNYLKIAFRHLLANKFYLVINTLGMGIAIACAMAAYLLVAYNIEFDSSVDKNQVRNVVKVLHHRKNSEGDVYQELVAPISLAPAAMNDISGLKRFSRYFSDGGYLSFGDNGFHETIFFADSSFMPMFKPRLVSGSLLAFDNKNTIFLSEKYATKYFGREEPVGKTLTVSINNKQVQAEVGAVMADVPFNSTFTANALMRADVFIDIYEIKDNDWSSSHRASLLFELNDISQAPTIAGQFKKYVTLTNAAREQEGSQSYELLPFSQSISPNDVRQSDLHLRIPAIALFIFSTLALIILLIACFNLTNTTLALSMKRLKEIGIRKVIGSSRWQIVAQLLSEVTGTVAIAVIVGFVLSLYIIPQFALMWELPYGLPQLNKVNIVIALLILLFSTSLLAGLYPAIFGSRQSPLSLVKGRSAAGGTNLFSRVLLIFQFSLCVVVLIAGTAFIKNASYQETLDFGYDKDMIITALIQGPQEAAALGNAIRSHQKIESVSPSIHHFAFINAPERQAEIGVNRFNATVYEVAPEYFNTVGLELVSGRIFSASDTVDNTSIVVDESFVAHNHLKDPLGTKIIVDGKPRSIVGVVSDHLTDLESDRTENYVYAPADPKQYQILVIRAEAATLAETKQYIDQQWKKLFPAKPLRTDLQKEIMYMEANIYNRNLSRIFLFMTILGCILSVSGLYSMASLNIHRRLKEIGVRKVLGASIPGILKLLNKEFAIILLIAAGLGGYGGFTLADALLSDLFSQHVGVSAVTVIFSGLAMFLVGVASTSITIWSAARMNPVKTLRSE